jgi:hypothetical protein
MRSTLILLLTGLLACAPLRGAEILERPMTEGEVLAERMLVAVGGRAAWAKVKFAHIRATHHEFSFPEPFPNQIWNDFTKPRVRFQATLGGQDRLRGFVDQKGWRQRDGQTTALTDEQVVSDRAWWDSNVYRTFHRLAVRDPDLSPRAVKSETGLRLEIFRADGKRLNWFVLNPLGEPAVFGTGDNDRGGILGPLVHRSRRHQTSAVGRERRRLLPLQHRRVHRRRESPRRRPVRSALKPSHIMRLFRLASSVLALAAGVALRAADAPAPAPRLFAATFTVGPKWDAAKAPNEQPGFKEHSANLARLRAEGVLVVGARYSDKGLILVRATDEAAARANFAPDPTLTNGTFTLTVDEFRPFYNGNTAAPATSPEIATVRAQVAAFNQHDPDAVAALLSPTVKWFSLDGDKLGVDGDGREAIRTWLTGYFKNLPDVKSDMLDVSQLGPFVSYRERASWTAKDGTKRSQQALATYEVRDGLIVRVWYFPVVKDPPAK